MDLVGDVSYGGAAWLWLDFYKVYQNVKRVKKTVFSRVLSLPQWFEATEKSYGFGLFIRDRVLRLRCQNILFSRMDEC